MIRYAATCDCGWAGTYTSRAKAEYALRRHSCERQQRRAASAERGRARGAAVDRTPKPCLHKVADHQHGTRVCYVLDRCRCLPCAAANAEAEGWRVRQKAYGRYDKFVDADPVREHLRGLMEYGIGLKQVTRLTGVNGGQLNKIVYGSASRLDRAPSRRVTRDTAERLLAVKATPENLAAGAPDRHRTPAARTHLRALVALGWSMSKLGGRLGISPANMTPVVNGDRTLTRATVEAIERLYDELCMTLPPTDTHRDRIAASRSRRLAQERGWLPPLALDDLDVDLESEDAAYLDEAAIERRRLGDRSVHLTPAEATELVRRWINGGGTQNGCERATGLNVVRILRRLNCEGRVA